MTFIGYEQVTVGVVVLQVAAFTIPANVNRVQLQATGNDVRYTMDGATNPTANIGMVLQDGLAPEWFEREDLDRIRFVSGAGANAFLNIHYFVPRIT